MRRRADPCITDLPLVRSQPPAFLLIWTIMHVIDATSSLYGETDESLRRVPAFLILTMNGTDETMGQVLVSRATYPASALRWNASFSDILERRDDGLLHPDFNRFDEVEPL